MTMGVDQLFVYPQANLVHRSAWVALSLFFIAIEDLNTN